MHNKWVKKPYLDIILGSYLSLLGIKLSILKPNLMHNKWVKKPYLDDIKLGGYHCWVASRVFFNQILCIANGLKKPYLDIMLGNYHCWVSS